MSRGTDHRWFSMFRRNLDRHLSSSSTNPIFKRWQGKRSSEDDPLNWHRTLGDRTLPNALIELPEDIVRLPIAQKRIGIRHGFEQTEMTFVKFLAMVSRWDSNRAAMVSPFSPTDNKINNFEVVLVDTLHSSSWSCSALYCDQFWSVG